MKYALADKRVRLEGEGHFIAPNAAVIGDVLLKNGANIHVHVLKPITRIMRMFEDTLEQRTPVPSLNLYQIR